MSMPVDADASTQYEQRLGAQARELENLERVHLRIGNIQIGLATLAVVGAVLALGWKAFSILWVLVPIVAIVVLAVLHERVLGRRTRSRRVVAFYKERGYYRAAVEEKLARAGLRARFDVVVGGDEVRHAKPAPDIFLAAAERLGVDPERCLVLEDSEPGLRAACAAGMRAIVVPDTVQVP